MTAFLRHYEDYSLTELIEELAELTGQPEENLADLSWFDCLEMLRERENQLFTD